MPARSPIQAVLPLAAAIAVASCGTTAGTGAPAGGAEAMSAPAPEFAAELRRTAYGVPHVSAPDYAGLGYGIGYAMAEDNICELAERMLTASGQRAKYLGPGENNRNVLMDIYHQRLIATGEMETLLNGPEGSPDTPSANARALARGYAAGFNRFLRDTGVDNISDPRCAGADWVRELDASDYWRHVHARQVLYQPTGVASAAPPNADGHQEAALDQPLVETSGMGSNAYGLGRDVTKSGYGVLLGNPHYPWDGQNRFYRMHLMIPGELNVVGAGLVTNPSVGIGHTETFAWTHTVSTARRFGYFELTLDPADPTRYMFDGESVAMERTEITVEIKDGEPETRTIYSTRFGPIVETETLPWTDKTAYAIRNVPEGLRVADQYISMWQAKDVRDLKAILGRYQATGFNTTAVDAGGEALYGDMGMIPNVSAELAEACSVSELAKTMWAASRVPVLDGSRSECGWATDADSTAAGVFGASRTPHLFRTDYVTQMNDSYWLTNPAQPVTGYSPIFGDEGAARTLRTRLGLKLVEERVAGSDEHGAPGFDMKSLQQLMYNNRHLGAELTRDDLVTACRKLDKAKFEAACDALAAWDLRASVDSRGAHLFQMFAINDGLHFKVPFDPADPLNTPNTLDVEDERVIGALTAAVEQLNELSIPMDARLGDVQRERRGDELIPVHGGRGFDGVFNAMYPDDLEPELGWTSIRAGGSWIMTVEFTEDGPMSEGILTYSQSSNPNSPYYADQTHAYAESKWDDLLFSPEAVEAATLSKVSLRE